jgi:hypothetical protein
MEPEARGYRVADELAALTDDQVAASIDRLAIERTSFGALAGTA